MLVAQPNRILSRFHRLPYRLWRLVLPFTCSHQFVTFIVRSPHFPVNLTSTYSPLLHSVLRPSVNVHYASSLSFDCLDTSVGWFYHFTVVLVVTNSCINPFIYAAKYREFQNGIRRLVACLTRQPHQVQPQ